MLKIYIAGASERARASWRICILFLQPAPFLLGPIPCLITVPDPTDDNPEKTKILLIELDMITQDAKHSSKRIVQIFEKVIDYTTKFASDEHGFKNRDSKSFFCFVSGIVERTKKETTVEAFENLEINADKANKKRIYKPPNICKDS